MKFNLKEIDENPKPNICPHFALKGDTDSYAAFPSPINVCNRGHRSVTPTISHQRFFCLTPNHVDCLYFQSGEGEKFPNEIKYKTQGVSGNLKRILLIGSLGVLLTIVVLLLIFGDGWRTQKNGFEATQTLKVGFFPTGVEQRILLTDTPQIDEMVETTRTPESFGVSPTALIEFPTPTNPDPVLALDTPIGGEVQFIIHRVLEGESLQYFADRYNTSTEAILGVNENLVLPMWVGWVVVIPLNTTDVAKFPAFVPHQIEEEGITLSALAEKLAAPIDDLAFHNNIDTGHILHEGEWVLVPRD